MTKKPEKTLKLTPEFEGYVRALRNVKRREIIQLAYTLRKEVSFWQLKYQNTVEGRLGRLEDKQ